MLLLEVMVFPLTLLHAFGGVHNSKMTTDRGNPVISYWLLKSK